jgi:hypothetical protein
MTMAGSPVALLERQVRKVRRRLFLQHLVNGLIFAWLGACAVFAAWWLAKPYALGASAQLWMDWAVGGIAFVVSTVIAVVLAARRTPPPVTAALSLDERFQLRERVTTSLTLPAEVHATPAGQALLSDTEAKITSLDVGSRFPVRFGWKSALIPAALASLVLLGIFYDPVIKTAQGGATTTATPLAPEIAKELEQKKQEFLQKPKTEPKDKNHVKSIDAQKIEAQLQEILKRPMTTTDEVKDRLAELTKLEEEIKKKEKEEAAKVDGLKEQLQKLDRLSKKEKANQDAGENKDTKEKDQSDELRKSLKDGETEKAKKEADRLSKKLKDNELNKEQKDHLKDEMKELKDDLERLKREREKELKDKQQENEQKRQEKEKQLEQQRAENKLDKEEFEKQKKELDQERKQEQQRNQEEQKQLDDLEKKMSKCEQCLKDGDQEGAAQAMRDAAKQLEEMEKKEQDLEDLQNELQRMQDLRESMAKACDGDGNGRGSNRSGEDDAEQLTRRGDEDKDGKPNSGGKKGGVGKGKRPDGKMVNTKSTDAKQKADFDKKGAKIHVGTAGQAEKVIGKNGVSLDGEIKQASQEAPESVETQRIPRGYKDSTKGYFKNIGNQKTGENIPKKD